MGRTEGTLICPKCKRTNPPCHNRVVNGCRGYAFECGYMFPQDEESRTKLTPPILKINKGDDER